MGVKAGKLDIPNDNEIACTCASTPADLNWLGRGFYVGNKQMECPENIVHLIPVPLHFQIETVLDIE